MRLRALLADAGLGLRLLGGEEELDRPVRGVMTTDLRDPSRYLSGGELVLTGLAWRRGPRDAEPFVRRLARAGVAALAAGEAEFGGVPEDLVAACARHRLPLFAVDERVAFAAVTEHVVRQVSGDRAGALAAVVARHRRLMAPGPDGGGPGVVLDLLAGDLDLRAWVLSPVGRLIAGPPDPPGLPGPVAARLAAEELTARRAGRPAPHRAVAGGRTFTVFPVSAEDPARPAPAPRAVLCDWLLAVEADAADWPAERLELLRGVSGLIVAERTRREAAEGVRRRLAREVWDLVAAGAPPAEVSARLRLALPPAPPVAPSAAAPPAGPPRWQVVVARIHDAAPGGSGTADAAAGAGSGGTAAGRPDGRLAREVLEEALAAATPTAVTAPDAGAAAGAVAAGRTAVGAAEGTASGAPVRHAAAGAEWADGIPGGGVEGAGVEGEGIEGGGIEGGGAADRGAGSGGEAIDGGDGVGASASVWCAVVACDREEATALLPLPPGCPPVTAAGLLRAVAEPLGAGLGEGRRLTFGVGSAIGSADGLRGALEEARHARRVAAARPGRVAAAGHEELASHVLLLPFVPDDVRRAFTARLLDPLLEYDLRHTAELVRTLAAFLESDGSWTRCAARLHLHVNTLRYRIGRIEQLTGRSLSRLADQVDFLLALRLR